MKYIKLVVALLAACIFVVPAFSMQDNGQAMNEDKQQVGAAPQNCDCPKPCDCPNSMVGPNGKNSAMGPMMDGKMPAPATASPGWVRTETTVLIP